MCNSDEIVKVFRDDKRKKCPVYSLEEDPHSSLFEQMVARAAETPKKFPMFVVSVLRTQLPFEFSEFFSPMFFQLRPEKGSSLRRVRNMDAVIDIVPEDLEVKSYQLIANGKMQGLYELDMDVIRMSRAEYEEKAKEQFTGVDYGYG